VKLIQNFCAKTLLPSIQRTAFYIVAILAV